MDTTVPKIPDQAHKDNAETIEARSRARRSGSLHEQPEHSMAAHVEPPVLASRPVPKLGPAGIDERTAPLEIRQNSSTQTGYAAATNT